MSRGRPSALAKREEAGIEIDPEGKIEEAEAAGSYKYVAALPELQGTMKGPKLAWVLKRMLHDMAESTPWFKEKALDLGLNPKKTSLDAVFMLALVQAAIENPSSPAAKLVFERVDGVLKNQLQVAGLGMVKHQVVVEELPDEVLLALIKQFKKGGGDEGDSALVEE